MGRTEAAEVLCRVLQRKRPDGSLLDCPGQAEHQRSLEDLSFTVQMLAFQRGSQRSNPQPGVCYHQYYSITVSLRHGWAGSGSACGISGVI